MDNQKKNEVINAVAAEAERSLASRGKSDELVQMILQGEEVYLKANDLIKFLTFQLSRPTLTNADRTAIKKIRQAVEGFNEHGLTHINRHVENFHDIEAGDTVWFIGKQLENEEPKLAPNKDYHVSRLVMGTMSDGTVQPCLELVEYGPGFGFIVTMFEQRNPAPKESAGEEAKVIGIGKELKSE